MPYVEDEPGEEDDFYIRPRKQEPAPVGLKALLEGFSGARSNPNEGMRGPQSWDDNLPNGGFGAGAGAGNPNPAANPNAGANRFGEPRSNWIGRNLSLADTIRMVTERRDKAQAGDPILNREAQRQQYQQQASTRDLNNLLENMGSSDPRMVDAATKMFEKLQANAGMARTMFGPNADAFTSTERDDMLNQLREEQRRWGLGFGEQGRQFDVRNATQLKGFDRDRDVAKIGAGPGMAAQEGVGGLRSAQAEALRKQAEREAQKQNVLLDLIKNGGSGLGQQMPMGQQIAGIQDAAMGDFAPGWKSQDALNKEKAMREMQQRKMKMAEQAAAQEKELNDQRMAEAKGKMPTPIEAANRELLGKSINPDAMMARVTQALGLNIEKLPPQDRAAALEGEFPDMVAMLMGGDIGGYAMPKDQAEAVARRYIDSLRSAP